MHGICFFFRKNWNLYKNAFQQFQTIRKIRHLGGGGTSYCTCASNWAMSVVTASQRKIENCRGNALCAEKPHYCMTMLKGHTNGTNDRWEQFAIVATFWKPFQVMHLALKNGIASFPRYDDGYSLTWWLNFETKSLLTSLKTKKAIAQVDNDTAGSKKVLVFFCRWFWLKLLIPLKLLIDPKVLI